MEPSIIYDIAESWEKAVNPLKESLQIFHMLFCKKQDTSMECLRMSLIGSGCNSMSVIYYKRHDFSTIY